MILKCKRCKKNLTQYEVGSVITKHGIFHIKCLDPKLNERIEALGEFYGKK